jgi:transposase-like protein
MGKAGPRRVRSYGSEFKLRAVQLSEQPGVLVRDVAESASVSVTDEQRAEVDRRLADAASNP